MKVRKSRGVRRVRSAAARLWIGEIAERWTRRSSVMEAAQAAGKTNAEGADEKRGRARRKAVAREAAAMIAMDAGIRFAVSGGFLFRFHRGVAGGGLGGGAGMLPGVEKHAIKRADSAEQDGRD
jgi:hypothetical protein